MASIYFEIKPPSEVTEWNMIHHFTTTPEWTIDGLGSRCIKISIFRPWTLKGLKNLAKQL